MAEAPLAKKSSVPKKTRSISSKKSKARSGGRWVATVKTISTFPPEGLFTKDAETIARSLASKRVSPKGPASGMRMLNYFVNRAGRGLSETRRRELERAKRLLSLRIKRTNKNDRDKAA
jgi:hypothetical protein